MSKSIFKVMALTLAMYTYMNAQGIAELHKDVFAGCLAEGSGLRDKCMNRCAATFGTKIVVSAFSKNPKLCPPTGVPYTEKPIACTCDYED